MVEVVGPGVVVVVVGRATGTPPPRPPSAGGPGELVEPGGPAIDNVYDSPAAKGGTKKSFAAAVRVNVPDVVGVPLIWPVDPSMTRPSGRPPEVHVYGPVPPATLSDTEYGEPAVPDGKEVGEIDIAVTVAVSVNEALTSMSCPGLAWFQPGLA